MQMLLSTMNSTNVNYKNTMSIDLNSYFYSKCNDRYQTLKNNYSLAECEKFYTENISNFVSRFLIKKVSISRQNIEHDFSNLKFILRHGLNYFFKSKENMTLQNLKNVLTNFYVNNFEFGVIRETFEVLLGSNGDNYLMDKIISYNQAGICLIYGDCDIVSDTLDKTSHRICFINDTLVGGSSSNLNNSNAMSYSSKNKFKTPGGYNTNSTTIMNNTPSICINCSSSVIFKKAPEGRSNFISMDKFQEELNKKHSFIDLFKCMRYMCNYFGLNDDMTRKIIEEKGNEIHVYRKNKHCVIFELIHWDEYGEEVLNNEVLNMDFNVKNNVKTKKGEKSILPKNNGYN
jgi:hypothetical protein